METIKMQLDVTVREASLLRSALHIACALTARARPLDNQKLANEFSALHAEFHDNDVKLFEPNAIIAFEENVLDSVRHSEHPDDHRLRELFEPPTPSKLPTVLMDDQTARHVGLTASQTGLVNAPRKGWIVQYNLRERSNYPADWKQVEHLGLPQTSRNAAYRLMRDRTKRYGNPVEDYRVVPAGTPDGPEKDRGFYTAEFFTKVGRPAQLGWNTSSVRGLNGTFPTAQAALNAINAHVSETGASRNRYRVKWHQSQA